MKKTYLLAIIGAVGILTFIIAVVTMLVGNKEIHTMDATVMNLNREKLTVQDSNHVIYTLSDKNFLDLSVGDRILIEYTGLLDTTTDEQDIKIKSVTKTDSEKKNDATSEGKNDTNGIPENWQDNGIFKQYYTLAYEKLGKMSTSEKIGQLILARYDKDKALENLNKYYLGGYVFFESDFKGKSEVEVKKMIQDLQNTAKTPLLTAVDEEGGKVVRVSSNSSLVQEKFKSPQELYKNGGFEAIKADTINKSKVLKNLGLNLNFAPVVDVATNSSSYMYDRTIGLDTKGTSEYAKTVIEASIGTGVSYTLKHFPGYGDAIDSHSNITTIDTTYDEVVNQFLPPFQAGIDAKAEAVMVNHNIYDRIDNANPASLSPGIHNMLRDRLSFKGIIITDNLDMGAVANINDATVKAILAGNDMIITTDYQGSFNAIQDALKNGTLSEDTIDKLAFRVLAWKYYKGLMFENQK